MVMDNGGGRSFVAVLFVAVLVALAARPVVVAVAVGVAV